MNLEEKNVIITGGANGIGKATAKLFLENDSTVHVVDINKSALQKLAEETKNNKLHTYNLDISNQTAIEEFFATNKFAIDILINNAGIDLAYEHGRKQFNVLEKIMGVDFFGAVYMTDFSVKRMIETSKGGSIVFITTVHTALAFLGDGAYKPSKHALVGYMQSVALECAKHGIRANAVAPGAIFPTGINSPENITDELSEKIAKHIPMNRWGKPEEIAKTIFNVATDTYMTGAEIRVDGGLNINAVLNSEFEEYLANR